MNEGGLLDIFTLIIIMYNSCKSKIKPLPNALIIRYFSCKQPGKFPACTNVHCLKIILCFSYELQFQTDLTTMRTKQTISQNFIGAMGRRLCLALQNKMTPCPRHRSMLPRVPALFQSGSGSSTRGIIPLT